MKLWCYAQGKPGLFSVSISPEDDVDDLKREIHKRVSNLFAGHDHWELVLTKVDVDYIGDSREKINAGQYRPTPNDQVLDNVMTHISDIWERPPENLQNLQIFLRISDAHAVLWGSLYLNYDRTGLGASPTPTERMSAKQYGLNNIREAQELWLDLSIVRGTPASGKTILALLLAQHIRQQEPAVHIIYIAGWPLEKVRAAGGWLGYLIQEKRWVQGEKTFFIFDDAQLSYEDLELWNGFYKNAPGYNDRFVIALASYGSPSSRLTIVTGSLLIVNDRQRVTLRPIDHGDGLGTVGLLFNRIEFDDLVSKKFASLGYYFDPSFFDFVFKVTGGHVGAIHDFVDIVVGHDSYCLLEHNSGQFYTRDVFMAKFSPHDLLVQLETSARIFKRGLPPDDELQRPAVARIFSDVLCTGSIVQSERTVEDAKALEQYYRNGWLHADKISNISEEVVYVLPSPLHRWFVEWKLFNSVPTIPLDSNSILELAVKVIAKFSPSMLSAERRIGPGCIQRPLEAQYQDEFYRSFHAYSNGLLKTFPEFDTTKGRVDFYIPSEQWGVELLREGDRFEQHSGRFSQPGSYGTALPLSDYIILDFRKTQPRHPHPDIQKLYHVVFSNDYQDVEILDRFLQLVPAGELRLLQSV